ncbi:hypothetical protein DID88_004861 [Monilinia fructigena]|uniref:Uncharacterized protein n=1 Tax=Monilinia fructigena TaxID=38457 RepID=A0A395IPQ8_9HELO|nr:hypothetical protein DID88_004861 [Monilinia fructigena]
MGRQQLLMLYKGGVNANMGLRIMRYTRVLPGLPIRILSRSISRGGSNAGLSLTNGALFSDILQRERGIVAVFDWASNNQLPHQHPTNNPRSSQIHQTAHPHENIYTIPNILTFSRLVAAPICVIPRSTRSTCVAVALFAYAGITDLVDGWIARKWNLQTVVGTVIDPMADKTLMTILTVCLAIKGGLPIWLATIILGRDIALAISAIYWRWISLPPPKTFSRYWDFSLPSAEVHPTTISKYNTALQLGLIGATTALPLISWDLGVAMTGFQYLVATTTIWSGMSYIYTKDAVKIVNQEGAPKKGN